MIRTRTTFTLFALSLALISLGCSNSSPTSTDGDISERVEVANAKEPPGVLPEPAAKTPVEGKARAGSNQEAEVKAAANAEQGSDWARSRGPAGNGTSNETGLLREFPAAGPEVIWRAELGTGFSGLTVAGGRLYTLFGKDDREMIVCFDANKGGEIWKVDADADFAQGRSFGPRATPCVDANRLYTVGASGLLMCLDASNGKKIWSFNLYDKYNMRPHNEGLSCSPLVDGKKLIVSAGTSTFAFDKTTGELIWRALEEKMNHSTPRFALLDGRRQLLALTGSNLVGLDPETGKELWRHGQRGVNCATPVVGPDNHVFTGAAYGFGCQLIKVNENTPALVYKNKVLATHHATPVLYNGHMYGYHDRPGILKCVELVTGKEVWSSRSPGKGKMIIADGQLIIITEYGDLALAPATAEGFDVSAKASVVKGTCYTAPTLVDGKLYVRSDRQLACIKIKK